MSDNGRRTLFSLEGFKIARVNEEDTEIIQRFLERCPDHYDVHEGRPALPDAAREILMSAPPNYDRPLVENIGIFDVREELVGFLATPPDYPNPGDWYIGLLLLDPSIRGQGVGTQLMSAFDAWVASNGGTRILISVADDNVSGRRFWDRLGFETVRTTEPRERGNKVQRMTEMARVVSPRSTQTQTSPAE